MKNHLRNNNHPFCQVSRNGSALLITLAFVILLTVLIVGFLSRSLLEERISASSANQVRSDLFASGMEATLLGDLEQEIISNSTIVTPAVGPAIYEPKTPANMVPLYDYPSCPTGATAPSATLANLLKISTTAPATGSTFPTAAAALTTASSINGRSVSLARWGESQLVDPSAISSSTFPAPNWIMVARDGSNPTTFSTNGANDVTLKPGGKANAKTVIGRYAYVIYDEGGLIDMNVAGQPSTLSTAGIPYSTAAAYRNGETFADLTQLGMTQSQIDNLIGWRNNASAQTSASGSVTTFSAITPPSNPTPLYSAFTWSTSNATNYVSNVQNNGTGNLTVYSPSVITSGKSPNSTDQVFTSRQELIQFIQNLNNLTGNSTVAGLQYMTHFSRGLNQPSLNPDPNRPISPSLTASRADSNTSGGSDATINPSGTTYPAGFLSVRVTSSFTRNDGSTAQVGEPLVKKRFNLNRLVWMTYEGPLCDGHYTSGVATSASQINSNADIQILANQLHNNYGLSWAFLQQGTAANIYNYFGLNWLQDTRSPQGDSQMKWFYCHTRSNSGSGASSTGPYTSMTTLLGDGLPIARLVDLSNTSASGTVVTNPSREPDFAELIKAGIISGSKAKVATLPAGQTPALTTPDISSVNSASSPMTISPPLPDNVQNYRDESSSYAYIQILTDAIDQCALDGYPTRIVFQDGHVASSVGREFYGTQNLPYIYRVRSACVEDQAMVAREGAVSSSPAGSVTTPGVYSFLIVPEIWNPHDQNSPRCAIDPSTGTFLADGSGKPMFPTQFRLVADSIDPDDVVSANTTVSSSQLTQIENNYYLLSGEANDGNAPDLGPGYGSVTKLSTSGAPPYTLTPWASLTQMQSSTLTFPVFAENSALNFTINENANAAAAGLFREPTALMTPNVPALSSLQAGGSYNPLNASNTYVQSLPGGAQSSAYSTLDLTASLKNTVAGGGGIKGSDGKFYLGIYLGSSPGAWYTQPPLQSGVAPSGSYNGLNAYNPTSTSPLTYWADSVSAWDTRQFNSSTNKTRGSDGASNTGLGQIADSTVLTFRLQYMNNYDPSGANWSTYDWKYGLAGSRGSLAGGTPSPANPTPPAAGYMGTFAAAPSTPLNYFMDSPEYDCAYDPRTSRFSFPHACDLTAPGYSKGSAFTSAYGWLDSANRVLVSARTDYSNGYWVSPWVGPANDPPDALPQAYGWVTSGASGQLNAWVAPLGLTAQNDPDFSPNGKVASAGSPPDGYGSTTVAGGGTTPQYYADPDGVVRRGMAAYAPSVVGQPLATANTVAAGLATPSGTQTESRPIVLKRPFKAVAELGYVFSGTPWKNLDFMTPESGDAGLLDLFTIGDTTDVNGLVAGQINLNTQQIPVLQALIAGAYKDEQNNYATAPTPAPLPNLTPVPGGTSGEAKAIATALTLRTLSSNPAGSQGPLRNISELVGKFVANSNLSVTDPVYGACTYYDGSKSYAGFSSDVINSGAPNDVKSAFTAAGSSASTTAIQRFRESAIRALSGAGQARVWNLMIDVVAQTGNYPSSASTFDQFTVQGEQRYWIHLAIDRLTGQVIDKQVEIVKE